MCFPEILLCFFMQEKFCLDFLLKLSHNAVLLDSAIFLHMPSKNKFAQQESSLNFRPFCAPARLRNADRRAGAFLHSSFLRLAICSSKITKSPNTSTIFCVSFSPTGRFDDVGQKFCSCFGTLPGTRMAMFTFLVLERSSRELGQSLKRKMERNGEGGDD